MKTTKKQFEIFKKECKKWREFFGLSNWNICYLLGDMDGYAAGTVCDFDQHQAHITLSDYYDFSWSWKPSDLKQYAFHEICHVVLERIDYIACARFVQQSEIDEEIHSLIRMLENVIFKRGLK